MKEEAVNPPKDRPLATAMRSACPKPTSSIEQLLVDKPWELVNISRATWDRLEVAGKTPARVPMPIRKKLYRRRDVMLWVEWGCPARDEFEARIAQSRRLTKEGLVVSSG
jgi:hypothetical protein